MTELPQIQTASTPSSTKGWHVTRVELHMQECSICHARPWPRCCQSHCGLQERPPLVCAGKLQSHLCISPVHPTSTHVKLYCDSFNSRAGSIQVMPKNTWKGVRNEICFAPGTYNASLHSHILNPSIIIPHFTERNWGPGELNNLPKIKSLANGRSGIWTQVSMFQILGFFLYRALLHPKEHIWKTYQRWHPVFWWHPCPAYCKTRGPPQDSKILLRTPGRHCWGHSTERNPWHLKCF